MLESLITSSILIVVVLLIRRIFGKRIKAIVRYALWLPVLLRLLLPMPLMQNPLVYEVQEASEVYFDYGADSVFAVQTPNGNECNEVDLSKKSNGISLDDVFPLVHVFGATVLATALLASNLIFIRRLNKTATAFNATDCKLKIFKSKGLSSACLVGLISPCIYISDSLSMHECDVKSIIAHECSHYKHRDHVWSFLRCVCLCIWWFNPLVWIAVRESAKDSELACDEEVIKTFNAAECIHYGKTLVSMLKTSTNPLINTVPMLSSSDGMKERIDFIVKRRTSSKLAVLAAAIVLLTASVFTFTGYAKGGQTVVSEIQETTEKISQTAKEAEPVTEYKHEPTQATESEQPETTVKDDTDIPVYEEPDEQISFTVDNTNFKLKSPLNYDTVVITRKYQEGKSGITMYVPDRQGKETYVSAAEVAVVRKVVYMGDDADKLNYGNYVVLDHCNGYVTEYRHLDKIFVKEGCALNAGDKIATMGRTGACTGTCLGFAVKCYGEEIDPSTDMF